VPKVEVCFSRLGVIGVFAYLDVSRWQSRRSGIHLSKPHVNSALFVGSLFFHSTMNYPAASSGVSLKALNAPRGGE